MQTEKNTTKRSYRYRDTGTRSPLSPLRMPFHGVKSRAVRRAAPPIGKASFLPRPRLCGAFPPRHSAPSRNFRTIPDTKPSQPAPIMPTRPHPMTSGFGVIERTPRILLNDNPFFIRKRSARPLTVRIVCTNGSRTPRNDSTCVRCSFRSFCRTNRSPSRGRSKPAA